jgi:hypothetical protein
VVGANRCARNSVANEIGGGGCVVALLVGSGTQADSTMQADGSAMFVKCELHVGSNGLVQIGFVMGREP